MVFSIATEPCTLLCAQLVHGLVILLPVIEPTLCRYIYFHYINPLSFLCELTHVNIYSPIEEKCRYTATEPCSLSVFIKVLVCLHVMHTWLHDSLCLWAAGDGQDTSQVEVKGRGKWIQSVRC